MDHLGCASPPQPQKRAIRMPQSFYTEDGYVSHNLDSLPAENIKGTNLRSLINKPCGNRGPDPLLSNSWGFRYRPQNPQTFQKYPTVLPITPYPSNPKHPHITYYNACRNLMKTFMSRFQTKVPHGPATSVVS